MPSQRNKNQCHSSYRFWVIEFLSQKHAKEMCTVWTKRDIKYPPPSTFLYSESKMTPEMYRSDFF